MVLHGRAEATLTESDIAVVEKIAELTSERVVHSLLKDFILPMQAAQIELGSRISALDKTIESSNGVKQSFRIMQTDCKEKHENVERRLRGVIELSNAPTKIVTRWMWATGGAFALLTALAIIMQALNWKVVPK